VAGLNDEYGQLLDEESEESRGKLARTGYLTATKNPEQESALVRISQRSGVPVEALRLDGGEEAQRRVKARELEMLPAHSPGVARFLSAHENAAVAHDDWENLSVLEKAFQSLKDFPQAVRRTGQAIASAFDSGQLQQEQGRLLYQQLLGDDSLGTAGKLVYLGGEVERRQEVIDGTKDLGLLSAAQIAGQMWESGKKSLKLGLGAGMTAGGVAALAGQAGPQVALPEEVITVPAAFSAAFGTGATVGMLEDVRQVEAGHAYQGLLEIRGANGEQIDKGTAATAASLVGVVNSALEGVGLKVLSAPVRRLLRREVTGAATKAVEAGLVQQTMSRATTRFGKDFALGVGAEVGTEVAQEISNVVAEEVSKLATSGEFDEATAGEIGARLWDVAWKTASGMAWLGLVPAGAGFYSDAKAARAAQTSQEFFSALGDATQRTKLKDRLPEKLAELVDTLTVGGDIQNVFAPGEAWTVFWQERGMDPAAVAETVGVSRKDLQEAVATGGDITIPLGEYTAKIAGTEHHADLSQDLRVRIGDMTAREAQEFEAQRAETVQRLLKEAEGLHGEAEPLPPHWSEGARQVYDDVLGQLLGAKLPQGTAEVYAKLWAEHYQARAEQTGKDAAAKYQEKPLNLRSDFPTAPWRNVDLAIDPILETLRAGKIPADSDLFGPSLTKFVQGLGGLKDSGGELKAMDAKNLMRKKGLPLDRARAAAVEAGYLPEGSTITDFLDAIAGELKGVAVYAPGNENGKLVQERLMLEQTQELLDRAGLDLSQMSNEEVRRRLDQIQWQKAEPVATLMGKEVAESLTPENSVAAARAYFKEHLQGKSVHRDGFGEVRISGKGWDKLKRGLTTDPLRVQLIPAIPDVIRKGEYQGRQEPTSPRKDDIVAFHVFTAPVEVNGRTVEVGVSVAEDSFGNLFYNLNHDPRELLAKRKAPLLPRIEAGGAEPSPGGGETSLNQSIPESTGGVNLAIFSGGVGVKLGYFIPGGDRIDIGLLPKADLSTFLHETGHAWLEELREDALAPDAPDQVRADWQTAKEQLGIAELPDDAPIPREAHEQWADSFLAYLQEGKAPSESLRQMFRTFKKWLKRLVSALRASQVELTPDVRGVFDRLLASEASVTQARAELERAPIFATPEEAGMSPAMFEAYRQDLEAAHEEEVERLEQAALQELLREQKSWWKERKEEMTAEVMAEAVQSPVYRVFHFLSTGKMLDGSEGPAPMKLDRAALVSSYGEEFVKKLPRGFGRIYAAEGGVNPSLVAELFGFESSDEMVRQMVAAPSLKRWVAAEVTARMNEQYGNMMMDGSLADEAASAVHSEESARVLRAEMRALRRKAREVGPYVQAAQEEAREALDRAKREREYERRWLQAEKDLALAIERGARQEEVRKLREEAAQAKKAEQDARRAARESIPSAETFKEAARLSMATRTVGSIFPDLYAQAERKAGREAYALAQKKDYAGAAEAKQRQLLNFYLYREAARIEKDIKKALEGFKRVFGPDEKLAKTRNIDLVNAARAILSAHGIGPQVEGGALVYLEKVRKYNPQLFDDLQMAVDVATQGAVPYARLSTSDFFAMKDAVDNLWHLSRRERMVEIDGALVSKEEVIGDLARRLDELGLSSDGLGADRGVTMRDKVGLTFAGFRSILRRVESWADAMDGGNFNGPFRRYIWQPISEAADRYRTDKSDYIQRFRELFRPLEDSLAPRDISAPELGLKGYTFRSKAEILGALLHTGNESNLAKLLVGRQWGYIAEDGGLATGNWEMFLDRMHQEGVLTKADWDFVQSVWDLLDELKPQAQAAHRDMYGFYFSEVTAHPVDTPWGIYRGGYFPAATDPFIVSEAAIREGRDVVLENSSRLFPDRPTTGRGFTKSRVENYRKALSLDMRLAPVHIDKVLRFIHLEPRVKDVTRVIADQGMADLLDQWDKTLLDDMLMPWLERSAKQSLSSGSKGFGGKGLDRIWQAMRRRTGLQAMVLNVTNALQQFTGLSISMLKVDGGEMRRALWRFLRAPHEVAGFAAERSIFMAERLDGETYKLMSEIDQLLDPSKYTKVRDASVRYGYFLQHATQNIVDVATWTAGYNGAVAEGADEKEAVRRADSAVRETQGSFNPEDISRSETGSPFVRLFTQFYSYFNMQANLLGTEFLNTVRELGFRGGSGRLFYIYMMGFMIPAVVSELLVRVMGGRMDDDDDGEYLDNVLDAFFMGQLRSGAAMVPVVGQATMATLNMMNEKTYDDRLATSPSVSTIESALRAPLSVYSATVEDGSAKRAVRDVLTLVGMASGLPAGALGRPLGYLANVEQGKEDVSGPVDFTRGLITGR